MHSDWHVCKEWCYSNTVQRVTSGSGLHQDSSQQHFLQTAAVAHHLHVCGLEHLVDGLIHMTHLYHTCKCMSQAKYEGSLKQEKQMPESEIIVY